MKEQLLKITENIRYCSAINKDSDYKYIGGCLVHRKVLQNIPYREEYGNSFEVLYLGKFRTAFKKDFVIDK